jgi:hypothetical protein
MLRLKQKWLNFILNFTHKIYLHKIRFIERVGYQNFFLAFWILILEILLALISLPSYLFVRKIPLNLFAKKDQNLADSYKLRKKITLSVVLLFLLGWVLKFAIVGLIAWQTTPLKYLRAAEVNWNFDKPADYLFDNSKIEVINGVAVFKKQINENLVSLQISDLKYEIKDETINLSWKNSADPNFVKVVVLKKEGQSSSSLQDGEKVFEGTQEIFTESLPKNHKNYFYTVFAISGANNQISPVSLEVKLDSVQPQKEEKKKEKKDLSSLLFKSVKASEKTCQTTLQPITSLTAEKLKNWEGFFETSEKNHGEIYYQLSDDDGETWKFWSTDKKNWIEAGEHDFNAASVVNEEIQKFPTKNEKILFRAFFESNCEEEIKLIDLAVTYAEYKDMEVARWSFDDLGSQDQAKDVSDHDNTAELHSTRIVENALNKNGLFFEAPESYAEIPYSPSLNFNSGFSTSLWFQTQSNEEQVLLSKKDDEQFLIYLKDEYLHFTIKKSNQETLTLKSQNKIKTHLWYHVAVSWSKDSSLLSLYLSGVKNQEELNLFKTKISPSQKSLYLGNDSNLQKGFQGILDEVKLFNYALTKEEIETLWKEFNPPSVDSCSNSIQDENERGIDCGGNCSQVCESKSKIENESSPQPEINLLRPNGKETLAIKTPALITWEGDQSVSQIKIEYSQDDFDEDQRVISEATVNDGEFVWEIGEDFFGFGKIRLLDELTSKVLDVSADDFYISEIFPEKIAFWSFDDFQNCSILESEGDYHAILKPACEEKENENILQDGKINSAFEFDRTNYLEIEHAPIFNFPNNFTFSFWIFPRSQPDPAKILHRDNVFEITQTDNLEDLKVTLFSTQNKEETISSSGNLLSFDNWHQVAITYNGSTLKIFMDGKVVSSKEASFDLNSSGENLFIGSSFLGKIDELKLYNRALDSSEINQTYLQDTNSAPQIKIISVAQNSKGDVLIDFEASDYESNTLNLSDFQFSLNGKFSKEERTLSPQLNETNNFLSNLTSNDYPGVKYTFIWDAKNDLQNNFYQNVFIRLKATDQLEEGEFASFGPFSLDLNPPQITNLTAQQNPNTPQIEINYQISKENNLNAEIDSIDIGNPEDEEAHALSNWSDSETDLSKETFRKTKISCDQNASLKFNLDGKTASLLRLKTKNLSSGQNSFEVYANNKFIGNYLGGHISKDLWQNHLFILPNLEGDILLELRGIKDQCENLEILVSQVEIFGTWEKSFSLYLEYSKDDGKSWSSFENQDFLKEKFYAPEGSLLIDALKYFPDLESPYFKIRLQATDSFKNSSDYFESNRFTLDTKKPLPIILANLFRQPLAGESEVSIFGNFSESNPHLNIYRVTLNNSLTFENKQETKEASDLTFQTIAIDGFLDGDDVISAVSISHLDKFHNESVNENFKPSENFKYVKPFTPYPPALKENQDQKIELNLKKNPRESDQVEYAIFENNSQKYLNSNNNFSNEPTWQTIDQWEKITLERSAFVFKVKSRNPQDFSHLSNSESEFSAETTIENTAPKLTFKYFEEVFEEGKHFIDLHLSLEDAEKDPAFLNLTQFSLNQISWSDLAFYQEPNLGNPKDLILSWDVEKDLLGKEIPLVYLKIRATDSILESNFLIFSISNLDFKAPQIENVFAKQAEQGGVTLTYDLIEQSLSQIEVEASLDNGSSWQTFSENMQGDLGENIFSGTNKNIYWDVKEDLPDLNLDSVILRLKAEDQSNNKSEFYPSNPFSLDTQALFEDLSLNLNYKDSTSASFSWSPVFKDQNFSHYQIVISSMDSNDEAREKHLELVWDHGYDQNLQNPNTNTTTVLNLSSDTEYLAKLEAVDLYGNQKESLEINFKTDEYLESEDDLAGFYKYQTLHSFGFNQANSLSLSQNNSLGKEIKNSSLINSASFFLPQKTSVIDIQSVALNENLPIPQINSIEEKTLSSELSISGTGTPYADILILISGSPSVIYTTKVDEKGNWEIIHSQKENSFSSGRHSVLAFTFDQEAHAKSSASQPFSFTIKRNISLFFSQYFDLTTTAVTAVIVFVLGFILFFLKKIKIRT